MGGKRTKQILRWAAAAGGLLALILLCAALIAREGNRGAAMVRFNEVLAANSAYPDPSGRYRDFVELYNAGDGDADLSGCGLTDNGRSVKYVFPAGAVLPPGGYLTVWCGADAAGEDPYAAPFSVARSGGETLSLLSPRGVVLDRADTIPTLRNRPMIYTPEGWVLGEFATPGYENSREGYAAYLAARTAADSPVRFSEFMTANSLYPGPGGNCPDWIELRNAGDADIRLDGFGLSDAGEEVKYVFPSGTVLPAGGYLAVWCGPDGTGFSLDHKGGETLCLTGPGGEVLDRIVTPVLARDQSWALGEDGVWSVCARATPGYANTAEGYAQYLRALGLENCSVVISEVMADNRGCLQDADGDFPDWVELYNAGDAPQALGGFFLSDDPAKPAKWRFPDVTLSPGAYLVVFCDGKDAAREGEMHTSFSLSRFGETVTLSNPAGSPVSSLTWEALDPDRSAVNSGGTVRVTDAPSPGYENTARGAAAALAARTAPGPVVINEVMPSNDGYLRQPDGKFHDWAELKNVSDASVPLSGWSLTDDLDKPGRFVFGDVALEPGELLLVILKGEADFRSPCLLADFALNAEEDWLYLLDGAGRVVDFVHVRGVPEQGSLGRRTGQNGFFVFDTPTPGADNDH